MAYLNYHHLNYFRVVAKTGHLSRAAQQLHIAQSALSSQIKQLEQQLGQALFLRQGRRLELTEAGRIALSYAENINAQGSELLSLFQEGDAVTRQILRIGAVATLSRNFQESFIEPLLHRQDVRLVMQSGGITDLLNRLAAHQLDVVLSNREEYASSVQAWRCQRIARQTVSLIGKPRSVKTPFCITSDLQHTTLIVPGHENALRGHFDLMCEKLQVKPTILAEVDDMAMMRVLARASTAAILVPPVVVRDELKQGALQEYTVFPDLYEDFFAITIQRQYQHPLLTDLLARSEKDIFD